MNAALARKKTDAGIALLTAMLLMLLMASMLLGFVLLINSGQQVSGMNNDFSRAFYAAEAGMEKMTADIGTLFNTNAAPTGTQIDALATVPPSLSDISYVRYDGSSGYSISYPKDANGNPAPSNATIKSGTYQGMTALATTYTLNVTARTTEGSEVKLQRTTQTVAIPLFQFGVFSDTDLSFFPGPQFQFNGRTHTNGNLYLAANNGPVNFTDNVTAVKDVIRTNLPNGFAVTAGGAYGGTVNVYNGSGTTALGINQGSLTGDVGSAANSSWTGISLGTYGGHLRAASTGPGAPLNLGIVSVGSGTTQAIDVIRRPIPNESAQVTAERYFAQASVKILLSDDPGDIMNLPCIDSSTNPVDLSLLATNPATWAAAADFRKDLDTKMTANNATYITPELPLATSGATTAAYSAADGYWEPNGTPLIRGFLKIEVQTKYGTPCGTWKDVTTEVLGYGYVGRNIDPVPQSLDGATVNPQWRQSDATKMESGYNGTVGAVTYSSVPALPTVLMSSQSGNAMGAGTFSAISTAASVKGTCLDPHPNAIIRLERIRDNPSSVAYNTGQFKSTNPNKRLPFTSTVSQVCGVDPTTGKLDAAFQKLTTDFWPNVLFDAREGTLRDVAPAGNPISLNGSMAYVEIDAKNLVRYLKGTLPGSGSSSYDSSTAPNNYEIYFSDRRGNYTAVAPTTTWPPVSPQGHETGEYGFQDFVNPAVEAGCPNGVLDAGEDLDGLGNQIFFTYGQDATQASQANIATTPFTKSPGNGYFGSLPANTSAQNVTAVFNGLVGTGALTANPNCNPVTGPTKIWPFSFVGVANASRENPNPFFRRALKIVNGADLQDFINVCPTTVSCGLAIAAENPVYIQGDYNCFACTGNNFSDKHIATSVNGDSVTMLSNAWNDINSFIFPYDRSKRLATTTYYRTAIMGGKGVAFPRPSTYAVAPGQDFGTDGGLHNFLRYVEDWSGQTLNYRGSLVSLYYNRQGTGVYKCCTTVYNPPSRGYNFDIEFLDTKTLPPRTPLFRAVNTTGFTQLLLPTQ